MKWYLEAILIFSLISMTCANRPEKNNIVASPNQADTAMQTVAQTPSEINYHFYTLNKAALKTIKKTFTDTQLNIILAINSIDFSMLHRADTLVIPDTFLNNIKYYSPFPDSIPALGKVRKIILFSYEIQAFGVYENGKQVRWGPTSMGKQSTPTPTGLFHTNWRAEKTVSTDDSTWIMYWYFNLHNERGVSMHQYELPGYPASHACIRLNEKDAAWLYHWAEQWKLTANRMRIRAYGTPVIIFGIYDFKGSKPWHLLPANAKALHQSADSLAKEINPFLPTILYRQWMRDSIAPRFAKDAVLN